MSDIQPFQLAIGDDVLDDLRRRLEDTRWPERETVADWSQGAPLAEIQALCGYWRDGYDWRRCETMLNRLGQYRTTIDGLGIHFLHVRSPRADALPLLLTHGWPGSIIEFHKVIGPLADPAAHGGSAAEGFHVVVPSLPGFGFSDRPGGPGWGARRVAAAWIALMERLGYGGFVAQGGDWGAAVTTAIGMLRPPACRAIHLNLPLVFPDPAEAATWTAEEAARAGAVQAFAATETAYADLQRTRPQTLGYALSDSPAGQAAWIYEKLRAWSDCDGDPLRTFTRDEMLDNIMLYWLPGTAASSARLYWESRSAGFRRGTTDIPVACSLFPKETLRPTRRQAAQVYTNIVYWNEVDRGGHFAALEQPGAFVRELREAFRPFR